MVNFNPFPFFRLRRRGRSRHPKAKNILDLPYTKYNQRTMLPDSIPIGGKEVAPFISIDESEWRGARVGIRYERLRWSRYQGVVGGSIPDPRRPTRWGYARWGRVR
jgi:hypothetical protein